MIEIINFDWISCYILELISGQQIIGVLNCLKVTFQLLKGLEIRKMNMNSLESNSLFGKSLIKASNLNPSSVITCF